MAYLIQQLDNTINIIETTKPAGQQIILSLSTSCVVKPQRKGGTTDDLIEFLDDTGMPTMVLPFDATLQVQDNGGAAAPFVGNLDDLLIKLNNEYFNNAVTTTPASAVAGNATEAKQDVQIAQGAKKLIGKVIDLTSDDGGAWSGFPLTLNADTTIVFNFLDDTSNTYNAGQATPIADISQLVSFINSVQGDYFFSAAAASTDLVISDGSATIVELSDLVIEDGSTLTYSDFSIDSADTDDSLLAQQYEILKKLDSNIKELVANQNAPQTIASVEKNAANTQPVAQSTILGNYLMDFNNIQGLLDRRQSGTASQTYASGVSTMSVGSGEYAVCQSFQTHPYFTGKSHEIEITFDNFQNQANVVKKVGYFDTDRSAPYNTNYDGFYLESDGSTYNIVIANGNTGTENRVPITSWDNKDLANSINFTNFTVMKIDFLYLGGTSFRFFFKTQNGWELAHTYNHANVFTGTIVKSPTLPVRWEIRSTTGSGTLGQICASVNTAGSIDLVGNRLTTPTNTNPVNANSTGIKYMLAAVRLKDVRKAILSIESSVLSSTNDNIFVSLIGNGTIAGSPTWTEFSDDTGQLLGVEYALGDTLGSPSATTVTGGYEIWGGYLSDRGRVLATDGVSINRKLGFSLDGVADIVALCVEPLAGGTNADVYGNITFSTN